MNLIPAFKKNEELIAEINSFQSDAINFHLWWLGQSGYLLGWKNKRVLMDPYLSDSLTKKYATTHKPHTRMSERVLDPNLIKGISIVTSSHNHTDHLDAETLIPVLKNNPGIQFIIPEANREFVCERLQIPINFPAGLNDDMNITIDDFTFYGIPAKHNEIERDEKGYCRFMGFVIEFGKWKIYHSGDTLWYDEMIGLLHSFDIDVALLPINGNDPSRGVAGNLNCKEAAALGKAIGAKVVIPCHYDLFSFNTANPDDFKKEAQYISQPYHILKPGEHFDSSNIN